MEQSDYDDKTVILLWSDHGYHVGEKDHIEKFALWEKTTHVPFIVVDPRQIQPKTVVHTPVDLTTVYPTLIELCGLPHKADLDGNSVVPLLEDAGAPFPPALLTYKKGNHAARTERWRYIQYADGTAELYDTAQDYNEWNNLPTKKQ